MQSKICKEGENRSRNPNTQSVKITGGNESAGKAKSDSARLKECIQDAEQTFPEAKKGRKTTSLKALSWRR